MANPKSKFQQLCLIGLQKNSISTVADVNTGCIGVETSKPGIPLLNDFSLNPGQAWIEENQMFGISNIKKEERKQDILFPTTTLEFPMNAYNFSLIAWLCYQSGVSEAGAGAYVKTLIPYTSP